MTAEISNLQTGKTGEDIAKNYLVKNGYKIIKQNYRNKYGEIDLVAKTRSCRNFWRKSEETLVFFEVRTKRGDNFGSPEDTIDFKKANKLRKNSLALAAKMKWRGACRLDAICVKLKPNDAVISLNHYKNIA